MIMRAIGIMICITGGNLTGLAVGDPSHPLIFSALGLVVIAIGGTVTGLAE